MLKDFRKPPMFKDGQKDFFLCYKHRLKYSSKKRMNPALSVRKEISTYKNLYPTPFTVVIQSSPNF